MQTQENNYHDNSHSLPLVSHTQTCTHKQTELYKLLCVRYSMHNNYVIGTSYRWYGSILKANDDELQLRTLIIDNITVVGVQSSSFL